MVPLNGSTLSGLRETHCDFWGACGTIASHMWQWFRNGSTNGSTWVVALHNHFLPAKACHVLMSWLKAPC